MRTWSFEEMQVGAWILEALFSFFLEYGLRIG